MEILRGIMSRDSVEKDPDRVSLTTCQHAHIQLDAMASVTAIQPILELHALLEYWKLVDTN
jgi:hypothetical protein